MAVSLAATSQERIAESARVLLTAIISLPNVLDGQRFNCDAYFDALRRRAATRPAGAARSALLAAAEQRLLDAHALVPIYFYTSKHLVDAQLDGFVANPLDRHASRWLRWRTPAAPGDAR